jgi:hypothetical protein
MGAFMRRPYDAIPSPDEWWSSGLGWAVEDPRSHAREAKARINRAEPETDAACRKDGASGAPHDRETRTKALLALPENLTPKAQRKKYSPPSEARCDDSPMRWRVDENRSAVGRIKERGNLKSFLGLFAGFKMDSLPDRAARKPFVCFLLTEPFVCFLLTDKGPGRPQCALHLTLLHKNAW